MRRLIFRKRQEKFSTYSRIYNESIRNPCDFWGEQSKKIEWINEWKTAMIQDGNKSNWFPDGQLNMSQNCIDRHALIEPNRIAIYQESVIEEDNREYSYGQLLEEVQRLSAVLRSWGVQKGDRVIIYMPMVAESVISMLACARVGAVHSVVFGGFSSAELANRVQDSGSKVILSASGAREGGKILSYQGIVQEALGMIEKGDEIKNIVYERGLEGEYSQRREQDYDMRVEMARYTKDQYMGQSYIEAMNTNDALYILYTSGTTGRPKGLVRDQSLAVSLQYSMREILDIQEGDSYFSGGDIGWVVGHHFTVYGPLLAGASTVVYEGKPVGTPDEKQWWRILEKYQCKGLYGSPTAFRSIKQMDPDGMAIRQYDLSRLTNVAMAGERCDISTMVWLQTHLGHKLINDNYWQTESGYQIVANNMNIQSHPSRLGSATKPIPGFNLQILQNSKIEQKESIQKMGDICLQQPLPPGFCKGIYNNNDLFQSTYFSQHDGYYTTGDAGYIDEDGYVHVVSRLDDVINTAGHRLSTSQMEDILNQHPLVMESGVVGIKDSLKGEVPIGFVVLQGDRDQKRDDEIQIELVKMMRKEIGPVASYKISIVVSRLPKTRSGKILRNVLRQMCNGQPLKVPPTIEDIQVVHDIQRIVDSQSFRQQNCYEQLVFEEDLQAQPSSLQ